MNLNGNDYNVSKIITDKYRNREVCKNIDELNQPKYIMVKSIEEVLKANLEYPMIIKPTNKGGKRGISVINSYISEGISINIYPSIVKIIPNIIAKHFMGQVLYFLYHQKTPENLYGKLLLPLL